MEPNRTNESIAASLGANRDRIITGLLDRVYSDPFWEERFGTQGRNRAEEDANHHLDNLIIAIRFDLQDSTSQYYHYVQNLLLHRGICTRLIREVLDDLRLSLIELLPAMWGGIQPYLDAGYSGLVYEDPTSRALFNCDHSIATAVVERLKDMNLEANQDSRWRNDRYREVLVLMSYLADAIEKRSPQILISHFEWLSQSHLNQCMPPEVLRKEINLLSKEITQQLPPEQARRLRSLIHKLVFD